MSKHGTDDGFGVAFSLSLIAHAMLLSIPYPIPQTVDISATRATISVPQLSVSLARTKGFGSRQTTDGKFDGKTNHPLSGMKDSVKISTVPIPPTNYRMARDLDQAPELEGGITDAISLPAHGDANGEMLLRLIIDEKGRVRYLQALRSTVSDDIAGQIVLRFYRASYRPGTIAGQPVVAEMLIVINLGVVDGAVSVR